MNWLSSLKYVILLGNGVSVHRKDDDRVAGYTSDAHGGKVQLFLSLTHDFSDKVPQKKKKKKNQRLKKGELDFS